jgi:hypothetical protein
MADMTMADAVRELISRFPTPLTPAAQEAIGAGLQRLAQEFGTKAILMEAANWLDSVGVARPAARSNSLLGSEVLPPLGTNRPTRYRNGNFRY